MNINYKSVPEEYNFNTEFDTYILAFCPDTDEWYATKQRFWFYEYPKEFSTYKAAIDYFENHLDEFFGLRDSMSDTLGFYYGHENEMYLQYYSSEFSKKFERNKYDFK